MHNKDRGLLGWSIVLTKIAQEHAHRAGRHIRRPRDLYARPRWSGCCALLRALRQVSVHQPPSVNPHQPQNTLTDPLPFCQTPRPVLVPAPHPGLHPRRDLRAQLHHLHHLPRPAGLLRRRAAGHRSERHSRPLLLPGARAQDQHLGRELPGRPVPRPAYLQPAAAEARVAGRLQGSGGVLWSEPVDGGGVRGRDAV